MNAWTHNDNATLLELEEAEERLDRSLEHLREMESILRKAEDGPLGWVFGDLASGAIGPPLPATENA
jgi:hypothetical protein